MLERDLEQRERDLQDHEEFDQVRSDDLAALKTFRDAYGLKPWDLAEMSEPRELTINKAVTPEPSLWVKPRNNVTGKGSAGTTSIRSRISSNHSTLSPLYEEDHSFVDEDDEHYDDSVSHNRVSKHMMDDTQTTFDGAASM